MSRAFTTNDFIRFAIGTGGLAAIATGAVSYAVLWRPHISHRGGLISLTQTGSRQLGCNPFDSSSGTVFYGLGGSVSADYGAYLNQWLCDVWTKGSGNGQTVTLHRYPFGGPSAGVWSETALATVDGAGTVDDMRVGSFDAGQWLQGDKSVDALYAANLSHATIVASGIEVSLTNWLLLTNPRGVWSYNQASTADPVLDLTAGDADQIDISGTAVETDEPPGFTNSLVQDRTAADNITISDTATRAVLLSRSAADTITLTDTPTRVLTQPRTGADTLTLADVATRTMVMVRTTADSLTLVDVAAPATSRTLIVQFGQPLSKWTFGPPFTATSRELPVILSALSTDQVQVAATAFVDGVVVNPTSDVVEFAFLPVGETPITLDWHTGTWTQAIPTNTYLAQCLVGPGVGGVSLSRGTYGIWVRVTDTPEIPVANVGTLTIV